MVPPIPYNAGTESENASLLLQFLTKSWPKIPDCIATDHEGFEAWNQRLGWNHRLGKKINAQEGFGTKRKYKPGFGNPSQNS